MNFTLFKISAITFYARKRLNNQNSAFNNMKNTKLRAGFILYITLLILFTSCQKDNTSSNEIVNHQLYADMKDLYLWYDKLPNINPNDYTDPDQMITAVRYQPLDRWSFALPWNDYYQYFQEGVMIGHGFLVSRDADYNLRIAFVYPSTLAYSMGIRRGWIIKKVNGTTATPDNVIQLLGESYTSVVNTIDFIDNSGISQTLTLRKQEININPVLYSKIIQTGGKKIGYIVFQDFINAADDKLDSVFSVFKGENIDDLIFDMRYNGGGSVDVALYLASWLKGNVDANHTLINIKHNNKLQQYDTTLTIPYNNESLDLNRITFIGTDATASASELIINGMKPYMNVELVGSPTDGKPVGMYVLEYQRYGWAAFPVSFKYTNAQNEGDFYDGLQPDILVNDDVTHDFGDPNEGMLKAALDYVVFGTTVITAKKSTVTSKIITLKKKISVFQRAF